MSAGLKLLASLIDSEAGLAQYVKLRLEPELFMGTVELDAYKAIAQHVKKYGKLPSRETCKELGIDLLPGGMTEPPKFYFDQTRERYVFYQLKTMLKGVESKLNDDKPSNALATMAGTMQLCQMFLQRDRLVDLSQEAMSMVLAEFRHKLMHGDEYGLRLGWPTFDAMTGGLMGGDLITIVGRPGAGKTYLMLHAANTAWLKGQIPLFVSMEMKPLLIMQRATAMMAKLPITGIKHAALPSNQQKLLQKHLRGFQDSPFPYWVVDGSLTSTVDDIIVLAQQLNPTVVFIDGAYLLRSTSRSGTRWERLTENAERTKGELAEALNIPVVQSYQLNRGAAKAKSGNAGLESIAYTDAIGQLSSVVLAMLQEESVETLTKRTIDITKGRSGEQGSFTINWNFDQGPKYMDFTEILPPKKPEEQEELDYI